MYRVQWTARAKSDLADIRNWLKALPHAQPKRTIGRIVDAVDQIKRLGDIGAPTREPNVRKLTVPNAPYIVLFKPKAGGFIILAVFHMAQDRP